MRYLGLKQLSFISPQQINVSVSLPVLQKCGKKGRPFSKAALGGIQMAYYYNPPTLERVDEEDAYQYIMDKLEQDPELAQEARDALIFWYFSGDCWRKMEGSS